MSKQHRCLFDIDRLSLAFLLVTGTATYTSKRGSSLFDSTDEKKKANNNNNRRLDFMIPPLDMLKDDDSRRMLLLLVLIAWYGTENTSITVNKKRRSLGAPISQEF